MIQGRGYLCSFCQITFIATYIASHAYAYCAVAVYSAASHYIIGVTALNGRRPHHQLSLRSYRSFEVGVVAEEVGKLRPTLPTSGPLCHFHIGRLQVAPALMRRRRIYRQTPSYHSKALGFAPPQQQRN